jgi:hypothetical protein
METKFTKTRVENWYIMLHISKDVYTSLSSRSLHQQSTCEFPQCCQLFHFCHVSFNHLSCKLLIPMFKNLFKDFILHKKKTDKRVVVNETTVTTASKLTTLKHLTQKSTTFLPTFWIGTCTKMCVLYMKILK